MASHALISKRGDAELRRLLIIGAQAVLRWPKAVDANPWLKALLARRPRLVAAVALANNTVYGLAGGVWGADADRARAVARKLRTGQVAVNGGNFNPKAPFGGYKQSGHGRELGRYGLDEYLEIKALQL